VIDSLEPDGWRFEVHTGALTKADDDRLRQGTKTARGNFRCILAGTAISEEWNRAEGKAKRLGARLMAIVAEGIRAPTRAGPRWHWLPVFGLGKDRLGSRTGSCMKKRLAFAFLATA
jgi:hypothetical protein